MFKFKKSLALTGALGMLTLGLGTGLAYAAPSTGASFGTIQSSNTGSLTITKHEFTGDAAANSTHNDPSLTTDPAASSPILGNVNFTLYKIKTVDGVTQDGSSDLFDFTTADWTKASTWDKVSQAQAYLEANRGAIAKDYSDGGKIVVDGSPVSQATDATSGKTKFANLKIGLYEVLENGAASGKKIVEVGGQNRQDVTVRPSDPIFLTLPMVKPDNSAWVYDLNAYPKNVVDTITKSIGTPTDKSKDGSLGVGKDVDYTTVSSIYCGEFAPKTSASTTATCTFNGYEVFDNFNTNLSLDKSNLVSSVELVKVGAAGNVEASPAPKAINASDYTVNLSGQKAAVVFDKAHADSDIGAGFIAGYNGLRVVWHTTLSDKNANINIVENTATLYPDGPGTDGGSTWDNPSNPKVPGTDSNKISSYFGHIKLTKIDAKTKKAIDGAKFQVYTTEEGAKTRDASKLITFFTPGRTTPITEITTTPQGEADISPIKFEDAGDPSVTETHRSVWVVETAAPAGYMLSSEPFEVQLTKGTTGQDGTVDRLGLRTGTLTGNDLQVALNIPNNPGFQMPSTGAEGIYVLIGAGSLILVGAGVYGFVFLRNRKKKEEN